MKKITSIKIAENVKVALTSVGFLALVMSLNYMLA
jgi:hypothetical protein